MTAALPAAGCVAPGGRIARAWAGGGGWMCGRGSGGGPSGMPGGGRWCIGGGAASGVTDIAGGSCCAAE